MHPKLCEYFESARQAFHEYMEKITVICHQLIALEITLEVDQSKPMKALLNTKRQTMKDLKTQARLAHIKGFSGSLSRH